MAYRKFFKKQYAAAFLLIISKGKSKEAEKLNPHKTHLYLLCFYRDKILLKRIFFKITKVLTEGKTFSSRIFHISKETISFLFKFFGFYDVNCFFIKLHYLVKLSYPLFGFLETFLR